MVDLVGFLVILAVVGWQVGQALASGPNDLWLRLAARVFFTSLVLWAAAGVFEVLVSSYGGDFAGEVGRFPQVARAALFVIGAACFVAVAFLLMLRGLRASDRTPGVD